MKTAISEREFTATVIELARLWGWRIYHQRPAGTARGWRTALSGDKGFPDLILAKGPRLIVAELKVGKNRPTADQALWIRAFQQAGVLAYVWYPADWRAIETLLAD